MELFVIMLERLGIIVMVAFVMTRIPFFRRLIDHRDVTFSQRLSVTLLFGFFGIIGTYTGVVVSTGEASYMMWLSDLAEDEAIANARVIGIVVAGLLGGWKVGLGAGLIAGGHRYLLGGFTGLACGVSAVIAGLIAGIAHRYVKKGANISLPLTFFIGALSETIQMGIILLVAKPYEQAFALVDLIGLPMIIANGVGAAVFVLIIRSVIKEEEKMAAVQSGRALSIAEHTISHMRQGLTPNSATQTCEILLHEVNAYAVSMTNRSTILSYRGEGANYYSEGGEIKTEVTKQVLYTGQPFIGRLNENDALDNIPNEINAAMIVPLKQKEEIVGTLKFYFRSEKEITALEKELIHGLVRLLSTQLELAKVEELKKIARETEIKALQAQVSPHFLFNTINIIVSMIRTNPERARKLLLSLSNFFRQNLAGTHKAWSSLGEEVKQIKSYLEIQQARFSGALEVKWEVEEQWLDLQVPTLTMQPLVENAIKHGRTSNLESLLITIRIQGENDKVLVSISDNGKGILPSRLETLLEQPVESDKGAGIGLYNVHRRLSDMISPASGLEIHSQSSDGTSISFHLERRRKQ
ncbi:sensor histidine kinase [Salipaludibacillus keqinensis]|uniref:histidine kinase n=1 Tax=Salipaludibacillus keqinensis TaxID=2045207 RepID=A0A323TQS9_9BACI|nr:LytS/YhcK type 5TM receptor domain-containing protein [Salipaludibacillus keqinensis]PYZ91675.1 sensor histidine kinase [Salipaludibacillus keqinensis]